METLLIYLLKVSIGTIFFYLVHILFLKNDTFFRMRRAYFLFALFFSLLFPLIQLNLDAEQTNVPVAATYMLSEIEVFVDGQLNEENSEISFLQLLLYASIIGSICLLLRLLVQFGGLFYHLKSKEWVEVDNYKLNYMEKEMLSSFSFFHWIVVNTAGQTERQIKDVLRHESVHASQLHSIDVLLYELFCIFFWWNPFAWLMKNEMKLNLEFLADEGALKEEDSYKEYQYTLLQINMASTGMAFINNFNVSHLKKRIIMMNKERTSMFKSIKFLMVVPLVLALVVGNASYVKAIDIMDVDRTEIAQQTEVVDQPEIVQQTEKKVDVDQQKKDDRVFEIVEKMPHYPGGVEAMMKFIQANLQYPKTAEDAKIQGRVVVRFVVKSTGEIDEVKILRGIDPDCDNEAVRVIKAMPKWEPGTQKGEAVSVYYNLPILFRLDKENKEAE